MTVVTSKATFGANGIALIAAITALLSGLANAEVSEKDDDHSSLAKATHTEVVLPDSLDVGGTTILHPTYLFHDDSRLVVMHARGVSEVSMADLPTNFRESLRRIKQVSVEDPLSRDIAVDVFKVSRLRDLGEAATYQATTKKPRATRMDDPQSIVVAVPLKQATSFEELYSYRAPDTAKEEISCLVGVPDRRPTRELKGQLMRRADGSYYLSVQGARLP